MYITIVEYAALYDTMDEKAFNRLAYDACRLMDIQTTGIDGIKKLKCAFPKNEDAVQAVKRCAAKIINLLLQIQEAEQAAAMGRGYTETDKGLQRKIVSRVEAGNEAISYSETKLANTAIDSAAADKSARDKLISETIREYLSGITDLNGVNLLYMGQYPRRYL